MPSCEIKLTEDDRGICGVLEFESVFFDGAAAAKIQHYTHGLLQFKLMKSDV